MAISFTESQNSAIESRCKSVVVSAAAGSGKTAVLVERIIRRITGDNPIDIDRLLVVTFTISAAADMKAKINQRLTEMIHIDPKNKNLKRQQLLLQSATIGTTHSFCLDLIVNNFQALDISPDMKISVDAVLKSLQIEAATRAIELYYQEDVEGASELAMALSSGRSDNNFEAAVIRFAESIRTRFDGERLFERDIEKIEERCMRYLRTYISDAFKYAKNCFMSALDYCTDLLEVRKEGLLQNIEMTNRVLESCEKDGDELFDILASCKVVKLATKPTKSSAYDATAGRDLYLAAKKAIDNCVEFARVDSIAKDFAYNKKQAKSLFKVSMDYIRFYNESKEEKSLLDFVDLELLAIKLLYKNGERSETAKYLSLQYDEVYVDEYQDANEIQDMIYKAVSKDEENIFMVGDVKQSIYRFRGAEPDIFLEKQKEFSDGKKGELIRLQNNFRSARSVVDFANTVFLKNMEEQFSAIDYKKEQLVCSSPLGVPGEAKVLTFTKKEGQKPVESEAVAVAKKIRTMIDSGVTVVDGGFVRPCKAGDFAILLRVCKGVDSLFYEALKERGISSMVREEKLLFDAPEISVLISFLQALHNPSLDIPMLATMLSPIFNFDANRLVEMKKGSKKSFSDTVFGSNDSDIKEFVSNFQEMRKQSATMPVLAFLKSVVAKSDYSQTMRNRYKKSEVTQNIRLFFEMLLEMQQRGSVYLTSVVFEFNNMKKQGINPQAASGLSEGDKVNIMTIHKSKGLEYKICFVCDLRHKIDYGNTSTFSVDSKLCCGFKRILPGGDFKTDTLAYKIIKLKNKNETVKEFLRLLYVALTRAEQKLFLPICENEISKVKTKAVLPYELAQSNDLLSFIKLALDELQTEEMVEDEQTATVSAEDGSAKVEVSEAVFEKMSYKYKFLQSTKTPLKLSVTELVHKEDGFLFSKTPMFEMGARPTDRGSAVHKLLQFIEFDSEVSTEVQRLCDKGILTESEKELINVRQINKLIKGELLDIINKGKLLREFRFLSEIPHDFGDKSMLQGVVDALVLAKDGIYIIDYKTDRVADAYILKDRYQKQLDLYADAIERQFKSPVLKKYIVSVYKNEVLEV